jgi:hypothetical protein
VIEDQKRVAKAEELSAILATALTRKNVFPLHSSAATVAKACWLEW